MRSSALSLLLVVAGLPAAGQQVRQQILLTFPPSPSLGSYQSNYPASGPNLPIEGPINATVAVSTGSGKVTLTSSTFLRFAALGSSTCQGTLTQTLTVNAIPSALVFQMCLVNLPAWGTYFALLEATAFGFPSVSRALDVQVFPAGFVNGAVIPTDVGTGPAILTFSNSLPTGFDQVPPVFSPAANTSWLSVVENTPCAGVKNGGQCTVEVSLNPAAAGLTPGTYTAQIAYDAAGQRAAVPVTYTYNPSPLRFVAAVPCRVADTRGLNGPIMAGGTSRSFQVSGVCNVPANAQAYALNVTVVPDSELGFLALWPTGQNQPVVSTLNSDGRVKANAAIVPAGTNGQVNVYASDNTEVILDIDGYFVPASTTTALAFYPLTPCRIADTRNPAGPLGGPILSGRAARDFTIAGVCGVPPNAQAYSLNLTAVPPGPIGYLTAWQSGIPQPLASTLNAPFEAVTANAGIIPGSAQGKISVYSSDDTHVIIDINGYFAPAGSSGALSLYNLNPCRVADTRSPAGAAPFIGQLPVDFVDSSCAVPSTAQAYITNATVVPSGQLGFLSLWAHGQNQPPVSTLNSDGSVTSNLAIVPTADGSLTSYASNYTQLILDISAYFAP